MSELERRVLELYGKSCTQRFCDAGVGERQVVHVDAASERRVDDGVLVTITVFVPDEEA